ncbi:TRAP transporter substrate-binding protein [Oceanivirga salmonicida]|uniref:TRAP transporter substrate-binding protein n=1 Tax=Oceanivirga salmonicida TaxID=1769291 RepID=UPI00082AC2AB|nr:TRAP transporter substrate-binding protein [Oceanivirga salmonicida]
MGKFKILITTLFMMLIFVSCGENKEDSKIVWKLGHLANDTHIWHKTAEKFGELIKEKTDGKIEVVIYPNESLGSEIDNLNLIQSGTADMTIAGESMAAYAPKAALLAIPYAFESPEQMVKIVNSDLGREIEQQIIEKVNVIPIYYHKRAPRNLTSNKPISNLEDLKGFKMRVPNVPLFLDAWKAAGAQPQVMAFSEVFTALQQGVISGQENPYDLIYTAGLYEVQKYVNETEHVNQWVYVVLGKNQFDSLSKELQEKVIEAAKEAQKFGDNLFENEIAEYKQKIIDKGVIINDKVNKSEFREAMKIAIKNSLTKEQYDLFERMQKIK